MDKLKKYAGYAGLGMLGGYLGLFLGFFINFGISFLHSGLKLRYLFYAKPILILTLILVGVLGGAITKKWWWAFLVGFIPFFLLFYN